MNENDLPKLTQKQHDFVLHYFVNNKENASESFRHAYDCTKMSTKAIWVEASKLLKHPNVALWIEHYDKKRQEVAEDEVNYSTKECFCELQELQKMAVESKDKNGNPNLNAALKAVELKGKIGGIFKDKSLFEPGDKFSLFYEKSAEKAQKLEEITANGG